MTNFSLIRQLEKNLLQFQRSQETKKTWTQWRRWLQKQGIFWSDDFSYSSTEILNWREFLAECKQIPDEWIETLINPEWLQSQGIVLFAFEDTQKRSTLHQRMIKLEEAVERLKEQVRLLYAMPSQHQTSTLSKTPIYHSSLPTDLAVLNLKNQTQEEQHQEEFHQIEPLHEVYLTTTQWLKVFQRDNKNAFSDFNEQLTESSHRISFLQMKVRLLRYASDSTLIEEALQNFEESVVEGILIDSFVLGTNAEENQPTTIIEPQKQTTNAGLELPDEELYQDVNTWIQWFANQGFQLQELTTQNLLNHSSHQISFVQFCRRIARQLDDQETFQQWIQH